MPDYPPPDRDIGDSSNPPWLAGSMALGLLFISALTIVVPSPSQPKQRAFISKCIEFHSVGRCRDFYDYGRQDLGLKPPKAIQ